MFPQTDKAEIVDGLLERVCGRVRNYFPDVHKIRQVRVTRSVRRSYSSIHWIAISADGDLRKKLIIKISETAAMQYDAMKSIWPHFEGHASWKIPRPLDYLAEHSALVMEEVSGTPLLERLPRVFWHDIACQNAEFDCQRAGQWLRFYHDIGRAEQRVPLNAEGRWPGLDETLEELTKAGFEKSICPVMNAWFVPLVKQVVTEPRPISTVHGDFTVDNVLMNHESVVVLDLSAGFRNAIDLDVAAFLNSILMLRLTRAVPSAAIDRMRKGFLKGYFGMDECAVVVICFLQGVGLADVALEIVQRRRSVLARAWVEKMVMGALANVTADLRRLL